MTDEFEVVPEDWSRGLAVVAHPDDMEYGAASAVARWTSQGKDIRYVLVTSGEGGISSMSPDVCGPLREAEQRASCAVVGVGALDFLGFPDGELEPNLALRSTLAASIRKHQPEVLITINYRERWGPGSPFNHSDHRAVGLALVDAARDAANPWSFRQLLDSGLEPWDGVDFVLASGSPETTHLVDVTDFIDLGVASLQEHKAYLAGLPSDMSDSASWLKEQAQANGPRIGVQYAVGFELIPS
jgi:LmbE family N-acetylglucosaminyl deacetylase